MLANHKGEIPFVVLIIPFLLGITIGLNFSSGVYTTLLTTAFAVLSVVFIALNISYNKLNLYKLKWIGGLLMALILLLAGWISVVNYNELNSKNHFAKTPSQYLIVNINNEPVLKNELVRFTAKVEQEVANQQATNTTGTLLIAIKDSAATRLSYGDELLIPAKYNAVEPPFNPAEFNYKKYLAHQNIYYQSFLYPKQYAVLSKNKGNPIVAFALNLRQTLVQKLKTNMHDTTAIAVASTLILGYKADLSEDVLQAYSKTGTIHVLSVSGAHVAILYLLLNFVLIFLDGRKYGKLVKAMIIIAAINYYALLSGFSPAVCRAAVMLSLIIIGKTYSRYINTLNILAISAFVLLLYNPLFITDVGFQLSYLAVGGLVVFQPIIYKLLEFKNKWADKLWMLCSISVAAQVITFPLSAFYFHQFPVYFLISNLFITIPVLAIMYSGLLYLLLPQLPYLSKALAYVLEQSILIMNKVLAAIEHSPMAGINKIWLTTTEYVLLYVLIICVFYYWFNKRNLFIKIALGCLLLLSISLTYKRIKTFNSNTITYLNLKKHPAIIFKDGSEAIVLTDLPAIDKNYRYSIQPYLDSCKIAKATIYNLDQDINTTFLKKKNNLIQFQNKKLLIYNTMVKSLSAQKIKIDYLYITGNPKPDITVLKKSFDNNLLVIDGSNSDASINDIISQARENHLDYRVLKRNNSFSVVSN
ncbi:MAG: ComEC/Rec2 family competence protein [Mucilaginibacter sp.]